MSDVVPGPVLGPCEPWISADDVASCCSIVTEAAADQNAPGWTVNSRLDTVAVEASMVLFELSGRQFTGLCTRTVRPCADPCRRWGSSRIEASYWDSVRGWRSERGGSCGCGSVSAVKLAGYPVRQIEEVLIDGDVVDPSLYRLDDWRKLTRLDNPDGTKGRWPACQNLALDDGPGTFSVTYQHGVDPPLIAFEAAAELACRLYQICLPGSDAATASQIPVGVARVVRQGIEVDRGLLVNFLYAAKPSGLVAVDAFLAAYGGGTRRRPSVFSPDVQPYARRVGS